TFIQYSTYALSNRCYMGVGRNVLYKKQYYVDAMSDHNFAKIYNTLPSGDDDLLIQELAQQGYPVTINIHPDSYMYSPAPQTWKTLFNQKSRHISTGK